jgi:hypothetical protein
MWVIVYCNEGPDQGMIYLNRALADDEIMSARAFADEIARQFDREIDEPDGYIPNCSGDLRVEFVDHEPEIEHDERHDCERYQGSVCIWSGASFYFKREDY